MRPVVLITTIVLALALSLAYFSGSVSLPSVLARLVGYHTPDPTVVKARAIEVESDPVLAAGRRLLQPLGFVRLTRVLPSAPSPESIPSATESSSSAPAQ